MTYDVAKLDEIVLALLHLNAFSDRGITRAWKSFDWDCLDRLYTTGMISDPKSKARSVVLTEEGARLAEELFRRALRWRWGTAGSGASGMRASASMGVCALCRGRLPKQAVVRHLAACAPRHDRSGGATCELWHVRAEGRGSPLYWIDLEVRGDASLRRLDDFLRHTWLECCGHMSAFEIGKQRYSVLVDRDFDVGRVERSMTARVSRVLTDGQRFSYEYDFGSTTHLALKVLRTRRGTAGRAAVRLLARNEPPVWPCAVCAKPASVICPFCAYEGDPFSCPEHISQHACEQEEAFLPVVNSPRMGVCGYTG
jgi:hypothetical protein